MIFNDTGDRWYNLRAMFISINENTGADKLTPHDFMVQASDIEEAISVFKSEIHLLIDYKITGVTETAIMGVFPINYSESN